LHEPCPGSALAGRAQAVGGYEPLVTDFDGSSRVSSFFSVIPCHLPSQVAGRNR
jgi:hypothetical protein